MLKIKKFYLTIIIALAILTGAGLYFKNHYLSTNKTTSNSQVVIELLKSKPSIFNKLVQNSTFNKKYLIINFWASWCPPCVEETPSLIEFTKKHSNDFHLFAISQDSNLQDINSFLKVFPSLNNDDTDIFWDDKTDLARAMNVEKLPETFIYSPEKNKFLNISGSTNWADPRIETYINEFFLK